MPSAKKGPVGCSDRNCKCVLCRELESHVMSSSFETTEDRNCPENANFILRRARTFEDKRSSMQKGSALEENCSTNSADTERTTRGSVYEWNDAKIERNSNNKTVIYFGDTNQRMKESHLNPARSESSSRSFSQDNAETRGTSETRMLIDDDLERSAGPTCQEEDHAVIEEGGFRGYRMNQVEESSRQGGVPYEIILNLTPSREDVLRIEEDESPVEDYWSLPGDTTGFKADWSFVQQWRLRG